MAWRNPLLLKKRGTRSTGMRRVGYWSELFLSVSLVLVGGATLLLHIFQVLVPDWRESRVLQGFEPGKCQITDQKIHDRPNPLGVIEYGIELQASRITDDGLLPPVWIERELGNFSPTLSDVEHMAAMYTEGTEHACWYDPADPSRLVLRRRLRWWPWPVTLIPLSLFAVGVWGIVASLMQVAASAERRSLVAVKAVRLDPLRESATLPVGDYEDDLPGAHYPHRLKATGTAGWRMAGLMLTCAIWNVLLAYFVYVASLEYLRGDTPWLVLGLVVLLGVVGVWLAFNLIREFWERRGIGHTNLEISDHPLALGGDYKIFLSQSGRMKLRTLVVELVCEEAASYQQGTDSRTSCEVVYRNELRRWLNLSVEPGQPFEADIEFTIPPQAMHSFRSPHNQVRWMLLVRGETDSKQAVRRRYTMNVRPPCRVEAGEMIAGSSLQAEEPTA